MRFSSSSRSASILSRPTTSLAKANVNNRRAACALDVVGEDLELRLRVDGRIVGQEQHLVRLLGVGLLGVFADKDLAVEDAVSAIAEDALVNLMARTVRLGVIDDGEVIDVLLAIGQVEAIDG